MKNYRLLLAWAMLAFVTSTCFADGTHWIWHSASPQPRDSAGFEKSFSQPNAVKFARLRCLGESASMQVMLDGELVARLEPYAALYSRDITSLLQAGSHRLVITSQGIEGPSAVMLELEMVYPDGRRSIIGTNASWLSTAANDIGQPAVSLGGVSDEILLPRDRQIGITAIDNYEQWKQAIGAAAESDPASFQMTPGFRIERVCSARPVDDSWVSMVFDEQGRLIVAKEKKGLLRMTLSDDGSRVDRLESVNDDLLECRGLLIAGGYLYANANNSKGLYRLASNGDQWGKPELVHASSGGVGHGRNDLALGPDGSIYSIHGDAVDLPSDDATSRIIDYTSPFREANRGTKTSEGHLLRIDPRANTVEVMAAGLRNPFGVDFHADGEPFTYDADAEYDMGSPWYRPTRVNHLVAGGDFGWRGVTKSWPPYFPDHADNALPNLDIGKGSPTAVKFGYASHFPAPYRNALFVLDWAYGRVLAIHVTPRGSSYLLSAETFLRGRPLNVTDLAFGPDGAMYLITGGRQTHSVLYRIRALQADESADSDSASAAAIPTKQQRRRQRFADKSRQKRHRLEFLLKQPPSSNSLDEAWAALGNADPWIQHAARNVVEHHPLSLWQQRALSELDRGKALNALMALARARQPGASRQVVDRLNQISLDGCGQDLIAQALHSYHLCLATLDDQRDSSWLEPISQRLNSMYPADSYEINRVLSQLLAALEHPDMVVKTLALLQNTTSQREQMHYVFVLRNLSGGWTIDQRRAYFAFLAQSRHYLGGAGMTPFLTKIRQEAVATLDEAERHELASSIADQPLVADDVNVESRSDIVRKWQLSDLEDQLSLVGPQRDRERGARMFAVASCVKCHRLGSRGTLIGPDLTSVSNRFSRRDLLQSILSPSKVIADNYRSVQVMTTDGRTYTGQVGLGGDYRRPVLRLSVDPEHPFQVIEISKNRIQEQRWSPVSWMPAGLLDTLTRDEVLDLLAYIESPDLSPAAIADEKSP